MKRNEKIVNEAIKLMQKVNDLINKFSAKHGMIPVLDQDFIIEHGSPLPTMSIISLDDIRMSYKKKGELE